MIFKTEKEYIPTSLTSIPDKEKLGKTFAAIDAIAFWGTTVSQEWFHDLSCLPWSSLLVSDPNVSEGPWGLIQQRYPGKWKISRFHILWRKYHLGFKNRQYGYQPSHGMSHQEQWKLWVFFLHLSTVGKQWCCVILVIKNLKRKNVQLLLAFNFWSHLNPFTFRPSMTNMVVSESEKSWGSGCLC